MTAKALLLSLLTLGSLLVLSLQSRCGNHLLNYTQLKILDDQTNTTTPSSSLSNLRKTSSKPFTPIRIYIDYTTLSLQKLDKSFKSKIIQILELSKKSFESILFVQQFKRKMRLMECNNPSIRISETIIREGVEADLIIFPYIDTSYTGSLYEAYASPCVLSGDTRRPVAGYIAFTKILKLEKENWLKYYTSLAMHELTHCLVFSPNLFPFYNLKSSPTKEEVVNGVKRVLITTPKVVQAAKVHFNCDNIRGVELENQGNNGTSGAHWEARVMLTDYMMGASYDEMTISEITLALFEDSGWYKVNYFTGGLFRFGKNSGCDFLSKKCLSNSRTNFENEFCDENFAPFCTNGRLSRGICYFSNYESPIASSYQYFTQNKKAGGLLLADYCPVSQVPTDKKMLFNWSCSVGRSLYPKELGEKISDSSICFISSIRPKNSLVAEAFDKNRSICYEYKCDYQYKKLFVVIQEKEYECLSKKIKLLNYDGELECPDFNLVCTSYVNCTDMIDCIEKKAMPLMSSYSFFGN